MKHYIESVEKNLESTKSTMEGISGTEAKERLMLNGKNRLTEQKKDSVIKRFLKQLADPMILILIIAAAISGVTASYTGESFADVIIIMAVVVINAVLGVYQESKAEKAIEALQKMTAATSKVLRDGKICTVKSEELVVGDVVILEAGDSVPADGRIIEAASLKAEEAALTGESLPVNKTVEAINVTDDIPLGDRVNMVYMGGSIVYGRGKAVITATGMATEMGKIADALAQTKEGQTPLQKKLSQLSKVLTFLVLGICAIIFVVGIIRAGGFSGETIINTFMVSVSLAVAAIPEGLAAVVTIVLSIGVTNMSKKSAVIRKLTAVETLGCTQIICSDKTGTLTQNKMTVVDSWTEDTELLAKCMTMCSDAEFDSEISGAKGEPTECALVNWAQSLNVEKAVIRQTQPRVDELPFDSMRKMMSTVHADADGYIQFTKGAPDEVLLRCTHYICGGVMTPLTDSVRTQILDENKAMAQKALRVLMGAFKRLNNPESKAESELCFIGLVGMIDPVRPEVKAAIAECRTAGIRPIMITGDHVDTARAIAKELGIMSVDAEGITGSELSAMDDDEFSERFRSISVYARVQPEHKTRIVNAWQNAGYITAMTGDGVNDAPSIKAADIGVGMGITGTDVTKNVADMVLADDNFATIVCAVEEGRRIYANIRKTIQFLLGSNLSEVMSIFVATILGFTILKPVHLLWINLITDCFPALALGTEAAEADMMQKPPRSSNDGVFSGGLGFDVLYQGLTVTVLTLAAYFVGHYMESGVWEITDSPAGMTMAFLTMSMAEIFHSFNMRSQRESLFSLKKSNRILNIAALGSFVCTTVVIYAPVLSDAFGFAHISLQEYAVAMGLAICVIPIVEAVKLISRIFIKHRTKKSAINVKNCIAKTDEM